MDETKQDEYSPPSLGGVARSAGVVEGLEAIPRDNRAFSKSEGLLSSWATATLGSITLPRETADPKTFGDKMFRYVDIEALDNRSNKITSPKPIEGSQAPSRARMAIRKGDVLFSLVRPYLKNIAVVPEELDKEIASTAYCVLRPAADIESSFLFYQLLQDSFIHAVPTYGNSPPAARDDEFLEMQAKVAPTEEQQRIVAKIEELFSDLDAGVAALERARANLKRYRAAVLKAAVEGKLTEQWRKEHPDVEPASKLLERILAERRRKWEAAQLAKYAAAGKAPPNGWKDKYRKPMVPDTAALPELPKGWCWTTMDQLIVSGPQNGLYMFQSAYGAGLPILRIDDFQNDWSRNSAELRKVAASDEDAQRYALAEGDIILNRVISLTHLGKSLVVQTRHVPALFESNMMRMRCSEHCRPDYLVSYLRSAPGSGRLVANAKWAVNQASINQQDIAQTAVPLPPLEEQHQIVCLVDERLSLIEMASRETMQQVSRASRLRQAILKRAFEGKLVPQDPNDEPAAILLERIRAARTTSAPPARNGRGTRIRAA